VRLFVAAHHEGVFDHCANLTRRSSPDRRAVECSHGAFADVTLPS
jgi:hypothetical protein